MALFPDSFVDDLKAQTDIVQVINEVTPLKKAGNSWKGLCPFHQERTPSFNVNRDNGFFKCFGCDAKGDVVKFVQLHQKLSFPEAIRALALRAGMTVPEGQNTPEDRAAAAEREALVTIHEHAVAFYQAQLATSAGARARRELESRGLSAETIKTFRYGYAPAGGRETLRAVLAERQVPMPLQIKSGLVADRDGRISDRFRNRLMIPIARDSGAVVAFGGRALEEGQVPKYLNSPETPLYTKGRTLYGLDVTKAAIRQRGYAVLVEGYFDHAQVWQAGVPNVVALCGTALTPAQVNILKRFASKVVLSLDPDLAGREAAARSSELLVSQGFAVKIALLPAGADPDTFIRQNGGKEYGDRLRESQPYLEFLLDRAARGLDFNKPDQRKSFLDQMLRVAAIIPDAVDRDQFADRLAVKARVTEAVVRDEIKRAASQRRTEAPVVAVQSTVRLRPAEQGLLWALMHRPVEGLAAVAQLDTEDLEGLIAGPILRVAASLSNIPPDVLPTLLRERLNEGEAALLDGAARPEASTAPPADCVNAVRRLRFERERAAVQDEIDRLQEHGTPASLAALWARKQALSRKLEQLLDGESHS